MRLFGSTVVASWFVVDDDDDDDDVTRAAAAAVTAVVVSATIFELHTACVAAVAIIASGWRQARVETETGPLAEM